MASSKNRNNAGIDTDAIRQRREVEVRNKAIKETLNDYSKINEEQTKLLTLYEKQTKELEDQLKIRKNLEEKNAKYLLNERERLKSLIDQGKQVEKNQKELDKINKYIATGTSSQAKSARFIDAWGNFQGSSAAYKAASGLPLKKQGAAKQSVTEDTGALVNAMIDVGLDKLKGIIATPLEKLGASISKGLKTVNDQVKSSVENATKIRSDYEGKIESRLQGLNGQWYDYSAEMNKVTKTIGTNPLLSQQEFVKNLYNLIDQGVAYNVEERALVATLKDSLLSTFDALDDNLQRLIRIQQADVTYSQLGAEATLTQFLNSRFADTSYLTKGYDTVSASIMDALSLMTTDQATSFSYNIQKWLGSLYAVGLSDQDVSSIAGAVNALATGNIDQLNGAMGTLLNMSASNAGLSYAQLLTEGLDASNLNDLMKGMITYLQDIAKNTKDNVTQAQWSNITGLSRSAFTALSNLSAQDISSIYGSNVNYETALAQYGTQMAMISSRTSLAKQVENLVNNAWFSIGDELVNKNTADYIKYVGAQLLGEVFGDSIVGDLVKLVAANMDIYTNALANFVSGGLDIANFRTSVPSFGAYATTSRGGVASGLSESATVVSSISDESPVDFSRASATTLSTISDGSYLTSRTVSDLYYKIFDSGSSINVRLTSVEDRAIEELTEVHKHDWEEVESLLGKNTTSIVEAIHGIKTL